MIKYMVLDILAKGPTSGNPECEIVAYDIDDIQQAERIRITYITNEKITHEEVDNIQVVQYRE